MGGRPRLCHRNSFAAPHRLPRRTELVGTLSPLSAKGSLENLHARTWSTLTNVAYKIPEECRTVSKDAKLSYRGSKSRQLKSVVQHRRENLTKKHGRGQGNEALCPGTWSDPITYSSRLRLCRSARSLPEGKQLHVQIISSGFEDDLSLGNRLLQMYGKCSCLEDARGIFDGMTERNVISWTSMITTYCQHGQDKEALLLFQQMQLAGVKPNRVTFLSILPACASQETLDAVKQVHILVVNRGIDSDIVVATAIVHTYGKFGNLQDARGMFDKMLERNVISWNAMIAAYSQHGRGREALELFQCMLREGVKPSKLTFVSSLHACACQVTLAQGRWMHAYIRTCGFQLDTAVGTSLVNMYGKCDSLEEAQDAFDEMPVRDVVSWTALIASYAQQGYGKEALHLFQKMEQEAVVPNKITFVCGLDACASQVALVEGRNFHACIMKFGFDSNIIVVNALINMYGKCGNLDDAQTVFDRTSEKNAVSWTTLIVAYAQHGRAKIVAQLFEQMQGEGVVPDQLTFSSILSACSHAGLVDEGCHFFAKIGRDYGISPIVQHYNCLIDLLGRAGRLDECEKLIKDIPFPPTAATWMALLGACRMHFDAERGEDAAKHASALEPDNTAPYVLLSNIYAFTEMWNEAAEVRKIMNEKGLKEQQFD